MPTRSSPSSPSARASKVAKMDDSIDISQAVTASEPIPSYRPDARARRYDRQLRLWASAGQRSLEAARILLIGCDATGCQALKNLVLPGIAHFTILSPRITTAQDVTTNFFLHPDSIGQPIAQEATRLLKELNPAVEGTARVEDVSELIQSDSNFFLSFNIIILSNAEPDVELALADLLWEASATTGGPDVPLMCVRNSGFIGRIEIQVREHCVVDTHPETTHTLRIDAPFPALEKYARGLDLVAMDSLEHSHVPWVLLLVRAVSIWKEQHGGASPDGDSDEEKAEFKTLLVSERSKADEENFEEALAKAFLAWNKSEVPSDTKKLLEDPSVVNVSTSSKNLHLLLHTLLKYTSTPPHLPPTSPALPDLHSSTTAYIALQNLYKAQYQADLARFKELLAGVLEGLGLPPDAIPDEEVEGFVKNTGGMAIVKGRPLRESKEAKGLLAEAIKEQFSETFLTPLAGPMHLALLAAERFYSTHKRWPGTKELSDMAEDQREMEETVKGIVSPLVEGFEELDDGYVESITEVVRGGFGCLPNTAAFLGGILGQEVLKLITRQYQTLDNTVIVDLVKSTLDKFRF